MECPPIPAAQLRAAIATLSPDRQRVYILIAREGLSVRSVAEVMHLSTREVEQLLAEALVGMIYALDP